MKAFAMPWIALSLLPAASFAASSWNCTGAGIEGLGVQEDGGRLMGDISWDCFPGDGICRQDAAVRPGASGSDDLVFEGSGFELVIYGGLSGGDEEHAARISAKDLDDPSDMGKGLTVDEDVRCSKNSR